MTETSLGRETEELPESSKNPDRWIGLCLAAFAVGYAAIATTFSSGFLGDPVGPRAFPWLLAVAMVGCCAVLGFRPSERREHPWPARQTMLNGALLCVLLIAYGYLLEPLGYLMATLAMMVGVCMLFGAPLRKSVVSSGIMVIAIYLLFSVALDLYLPAIPSF